jgi:SPW repeat
MLLAKWRNESLFDVCNAGLAACLLSAPSLFGFTSITDASRDAWLCGAVIGALSIAAIVAYADWQEWVTLVVGLWVAASPWTLAFHTTAPPAVRIDVAVGVVVAIFAGTELWVMHRSPPHGTD